MKILIAYYSRTGATEELAKVLKGEFEMRGHLVEMERVYPIKEHSFLTWYLMRIFKRECPIKELKIKDVSNFDAILIGSPNWQARLSLPMARYLREVEGLEEKNVGFFATTFSLPLPYLILLKFTFSRNIKKKTKKITAELVLSSWIKKYSLYSEYGKKAIKNFCDKIETIK